MKNSEEMAKTVLQRLEQEEAKQKKTRKQWRIWSLRLISMACYGAILVGTISLWQRLDKTPANLAFDAPEESTAATEQAAFAETSGQSPETLPAETTAAPQTEPMEATQATEPVISTGALLTAPERQYRFYALQLVIEDGKVLRYLVLDGKGQSLLEDGALAGLTAEEAFPLLLQPLVEAGYIVGDAESAPALMLAAYDSDGYDKNGRLHAVIERDGLGSVISTALANWGIPQRILEREQTDDQYMRMLSQTCNTPTEHLQPVLEQVRQYRELALTEAPGRIVAELFSMDIAKELITPKYRIGDYDPYGELILYGPEIETPAPSWSQADVSPEIWATYVKIYTPEDLAMLMRPRIWTTMTNVVGMDENEAGALLRSRNIVPRICYENNEEYRAKGFTDGQVFKQDVEPGMRWNSDASMFLWVMTSHEPEFNGRSQGWHPDGYDPTQSQDCIGAPAENSDHVMKAWVGEFSEENLKATIRTYSNSFPRFVPEDGEKLSQVSFETDFQITAGGVARLACVDEVDPDVELKRYMDSYVDMIWNGNCATVITDWWYQNSGWTSEYPVWSYLVWLKDQNGTTHYYYFRTVYTAYPFIAD